MGSTVRPTIFLGARCILPGKACLLRRQDSKPCLRKLEMMPEMASGYLVLAMLDPPGVMALYGGGSRPTSPRWLEDQFVDLTVCVEAVGLQSLVGEYVDGVANDHGTGGRAEGRKSHQEKRPEVVVLAKQLYRRRLSLRGVAAELSRLGHTSKNGKPFSPQSVRNMLS